MAPQKVFLPIIPGISMACAVLIYRCANTLPNLFQNFWALIMASATFGHAE